MKKKQKLIQKLRTQRNENTTNATNENTLYVAATKLVAT